MLDWILFAVALAAGTAESPAPQQTAPAPASAGNTAQAEPQVATGRFTTALEVKPILTATRANWVAVRDYNGQDLVYVTHLWSWRCGLVGLRWAVNGEALEDWPLPPCHTETAAPNAVLPDDGLPYVALPAGSVQSVQVEITYDDLSTDSASFDRAQVLMP